MISDFQNDTFSKSLLETTYPNVEDLFIKDMNQQSHLHLNDDSFIIENINHQSGGINLMQKNQSSDSQEEKFQFKIQSRGRKIKKNNLCGHPDKEHYAKGMCRSCYSKYGRNKKPWNCTHEKLYAQGLCQLCYANKYNQVKKLERFRNSSGSSCEEPL